MTNNPKHSKLKIRYLESNLLVNEYFYIPKYYKINSRYLKMSFITINLN